jgi:hypothetical protein
MFEETDLVFNTSHFPQTFLTNPSKLRIYLVCKIATVITDHSVNHALLWQYYTISRNHAFNKEIPNR